MCPKCFLSDHKPEHKDKTILIKDLEKSDSPFCGNWPFNKDIREIMNKCEAIIENKFDEDIYDLESSLDFL